jgi:hypothetical protein
LTQQQNVSLNIGQTIKIEDKASHIKDRNKALKIIAQSLLIAITVLTIIGGIIVTQIFLKRLDKVNPDELAKYLAEKSTNPL